MPRIYSNRTVAKSEITKIELAGRIEMEAAITDARLEKINFDRLRSIDLNFENYKAASPWRRVVLSYLLCLPNFLTYLHRRPTAVC